MQDEAFDAVLFALALAFFGDVSVEITGEFLNRRFIDLKVSWHFYIIFLHLAR